MPLNKPNSPRSALLALQQDLLKRIVHMNGVLLQPVPVSSEESMLEYYRTLREWADDAYKIALRMSQVSAVAMDAISPGSSNQIPHPAEAEPQKGAEAFLRTLRQQPKIEGERERGENHPDDG